MQNAECRMQNAVSSECAETRSNGSEACPHEQYDYVSRVGKKFINVKCTVENHGALFIWLVLYTH